MHALKNEQRMFLLNLFHEYTGSCIESSTSNDQPSAQFLSICLCPLLNLPLFLAHGEVHDGKPQNSNASKDECNKRVNDKDDNKTEKQKGQ